MPSLSELAAKVQRARTEVEALDTLCEGLRSLGLLAAVLKLAGDQLTLLRASASAEVERLFDRYVGAPYRSVPVPLAAVEPVRRCLERRRWQYEENLVTCFEPVFAAGTRGKRAGLDAESARLGLVRGVLAPLFVHDRPWGVLVLTATVLGEADGAALGLFALQVSSALESAENICDLERKNRHLAAIQAVTLVGSGLSLEAALPLFAASAAEATDSDVALIYLLDARGTELVLGGDFGTQGELDSSQRLPLEAILPPGRRAPLDPFAFNVGRDLPKEYRAEAGRRGHIEGAFVPLLAEGRLAGTLLLSRRRPQPYSADELSPAKVLAEQITIQVERARFRLDEARRVVELSLLYDLSRIASEATEVGPLVDRVLEKVTRSLAVDASTIQLFDGERLVVAGRHGSTSGTRGCGLSHGATRLPDCACDLAFRNRETRLDGASCRLGVAPCRVAATPLVANDRLVGAFCIERRGPHPLGENEVRLLESCAGHVGVAIEHARHLERERRRAKDLALLNELGALLAQHLELSEVLSAGVRQLARITGTPNAFLLLLEPDGGPLRMAASNVEDATVRRLSIPRWEVPEWLTDLRSNGNQARTGLFASVRGAARELVERHAPFGFMSVPLVTKGEVLGTVVLGETRAGHPFATAEAERATAVANHLAAAISNARLYETERQRAEQFRLLHDVGRAITATLDLEQTLSAAATSMSRMVDASMVFIHLRDRATGRLRGAATSEAAHREFFLTTSLGPEDPSLAIACIRRRQPVIATDTHATDEVFRAMCDRTGAGSLLALPLIVRDEPIGAVVIGDTRPGRLWSDAEVERATLISRQMAVAMDNARLFDDLKRSYDELARTQQALVKRERLAALGELAAIVAHEVRNPLGVIFNSVTALNRAVPLEGEAAVLLRMVGEEADRLNRIVGGLLDFARPNEPSLEPEPVDALVAGAVEAASASGGGRSRVEVHLEPAVRRVWVDRRMLHQALVNLVENAVQAAPDANVVVRTSATTRQGKAMLRIDVCDSGPGVPAELADRIFQPFFTTKATGTGLGLAVVMRVVEAHHGEVSVGATPGGGATFTVLLPADSQSQERGATP